MTSEVRTTLLLNEEIARLQAEVRRLQVGRIGDAENTGREMSRAEKLAEIVQAFAAHPVECRSALDEPCSCGLAEKLQEVGVELAE